jgi:hypothetical protein
LGRPAFFTTSGGEHTMANLDRTIEAVEREIANLPREIGVIIDLGGNILKALTDEVTKNGHWSGIDMHRIPFTREERELARGNVFVHNHPCAPVTFSVADLQHALECGVHETRVVCADVRFVASFRNMSDGAARALIAQANWAYADIDELSKKDELTDAAVHHRELLALKSTFPEFIYEDNIGEEVDAYAERLRRAWTKMLPARTVHTNGGRSNMKRDYAALGLDDLITGYAASQWFEQMENHKLATQQIMGATAKGTCKCQFVNGQRLTTIRWVQQYLDRGAQVKAQREAER